MRHRWRLTCIRPRSRVHHSGCRRCRKRFDSRPRPRTAPIHSPREPRTGLPGCQWAQLDRERDLPASARRCPTQRRCQRSSPPAVLASGSARSEPVNERCVPSQPATPSTLSNTQPILRRISTPPGKAPCPSGATLSDIERRTPALRYVPGRRAGTGSVARQTDQWQTTAALPGRSQRGLRPIG